ncbi:galactose mutarotase [Carboxylicivirga sp. A043]|uniref:aldose epimerase family protein n=1 Tax=Carboxylicivirga litoralis TaxID=2816963 RepID=UPI0021CB1813|nr:aldose epimerase family protein [Carboxylicivirga sp. A043]MCU4155656.1 galactose mutarotase [Carboxylicivirga sp. A043]
MANAADTYTLKNSNNIEVTFIARGGQITGIKVPNTRGEMADVVIGYETTEKALAGDAYFGALCGRYANRIVNGQFELNGEKIQLDTNNGSNHLHGGNDGFNLRTWDVEEVDLPQFAQAYKLMLVSPDGDQNYPGELTTVVTYGLTEDNELVIEYDAVSTKDTIINLTSHAYFNLAGAGTGTIAEHELTLNADKFTPIDGEIGTVTGEILDVEKSAMDFRSAKKIGEALSADCPQVKLVDGIDHNFVINGFDGMLKLAARLEHEASGRAMEVYTDQPGIQIYTGSHFDGSETGKLGNPIEKWAGLAMETQIFPDSPNKEHFPDATLKAEEHYKHTCVYKFI